MQNSFTLTKRCNWRRNDKKELIINENLWKLVDEKTSQDIIIEAVYNKRLELKKHTIKQVQISIRFVYSTPNAGRQALQKKEEMEAF